VLPIVYDVDYIQGWGAAGPVLTVSPFPLDVAEGL